MFLHSDVFHHRSNGLKSRNQRMHVVVALWGPAALSLEQSIWWRTQQLRLFPIAWLLGAREPAILDYMLAEKPERACWRRETEQEVHRQEGTEMSKATWDASWLWVLFSSVLVYFFLYLENTLRNLNKKRLLKTPLIKSSILSLKICQIISQGVQTEVLHVQWERGEATDMKHHFAELHKHWNTNESSFLTGRQSD